MIAVSPSISTRVSLTTSLTSTPTPVVLPTRDFMPLEGRALDRFYAFFKHRTYEYRAKLETPDGPKELTIVVPFAKLLEKWVQKLKDKYIPIKGIYLKGGAVEKILEGTQRKLSDLDLCIEIEKPRDWKEPQKAILEALGELGETEWWTVPKTKGYARTYYQRHVKICTMDIERWDESSADLFLQPGGLTNRRLALTNGNEYALYGFPTFLQEKEEELDIQLEVQNPTPCFCSYDCRQLDLMPLIDSKEPPRIAAVGGYNVREVMALFKNRRFILPSDKLATLREGFRAYARIVTNGYISNDLTLQTEQQLYDFFLQESITADLAKVSKDLDLYLEMIYPSAPERNLHLNRQRIWSAWKQFTSGYQSGEILRPIDIFQSFLKNLSEEDQKIFRGLYKRFIPEKADIENCSKYLNAYLEEQFPSSHRKILSADRERIWKSWQAQILNHRSNHLECAEEVLREFLNGLSENDQTTLTPFVDQYKPVYYTKLTDLDHYVSKHFLNDPEAVTLFLLNYYIAFIRSSRDSKGTIQPTQKEKEQIEALILDKIYRANELERPADLPFARAEVHLAFAYFYFQSDVLKTVLPSGQRFFEAEKKLFLLAPSPNDASGWFESLKNGLSQCLLLRKFGCKDPDAFFPTKMQSLIDRQSSLHKIDDPVKAANDFLAALSDSMPLPSDCEKKIERLLLALLKQSEVPLAMKLLQRLLSAKMNFPFFRIFPALCETDLFGAAKLFFTLRSKNDVDPFPYLSTFAEKATTLEDWKQFFEMLKTAKTERIAELLLPILSKCLDHPSLMPLLTKWIRGIPLNPIKNRCRELLEQKVVPPCLHMLLRELTKIHGMTLFEGNDALALFYWEGLEPPERIAFYPSMEQWFLKTEQFPKIFAQFVEDVCKLKKPSAEHLLKGLKELISRKSLSLDALKAFDCLAKYQNYVLKMPEVLLEFLRVEKCLSLEESSHGAIWSAIKFFKGKASQKIAPKTEKIILANLQSSDAGYFELEDAVEFLLRQKDFYSISGDKVLNSMLNLLRKSGTTPKEKLHLTLTFYNSAKRLQTNHAFTIKFGDQLAVFLIDTLSDAVKIHASDSTLAVSQDTTVPEWHELLTLLTINIPAYFSAVQLDTLWRLISPLTSLHPDHYSVFQEALQPFASNSPPLQVYLIRRQVCRDLIDAQANYPETSRCLEQALNELDEIFRVANKLQATIFIGRDIYSLSCSLLEKIGLRFAAHPEELPHQQSLVRLIAKLKDWIGLVEDDALEAPFLEERFLEPALQAIQTIPATHLTATLSDDEPDSPRQAANLLTLAQELKRPFERYHFSETELVALSPTELLEKGKIAAKFDHKMAYLNAALKKDSTRNDVRMQMGIFLQSKNKWLDALYQFEQIDHQTKDLYKYKLISYLGLKRFDSAKKLLEEAIVFQPEEEFYPLNLIWVYYNTNELEQGIQIGEEFLKKFPNSIPILGEIAQLHRKKITQLEAVDAKVGGLFITPKIQIQTHYKKMAILYAKCVEINPTEYGWINNYGVVCLTLGTYDKAFYAKAQKALLRAHKLKPTYGVTQFNLANTYHFLGEHDKAVSTAEEAIKDIIQDENNSDVIIGNYYESLGRFYLYSSTPEKAEENFLKAEQCDQTQRKITKGEHGLALISRGYALLKKNDRESLEKAKQDFSLALKYVPSPADLMYKKAKLGLTKLSRLL